VTRELSIQDVAGIIERVPDLCGMMLVGGQALNYWAETLGIADASSTGIYGPATSEVEKYEELRERIQARLDK
jgi:hypothetical protein